MNESLKAKNNHLGNILTDMKRVMVAFSGGVDSSLILKRAKEELGDQVIAAIVASELFRQEEFDHAVKLAQDLGVRVYETEIKELTHPAIVANNPDSWYHSKKMLYTHLNKLAEELDFPFVLDGMIMDDINDFRPGLKARTEAGVRSVLQEANFYKTEVRELAKHIDLPVWDKAASCSLASRIPYGEKVTVIKINQVEQAERFMQGLGFAEIRVRHHGTLAKIEVAPERIADVLEQRDRVQNKLVSLGFTHVSIDLVGYRTGSMNEGLPVETTTPLHVANN